ncbi:hypothetical protein AS9A_0762 [Hoyosella subflava DQS3-9A1]|uniref:Uncharacterized protein n=1 Tax=Hoyosella subflava (strain DSM 45089 / JCM 17490 / NBRC 109087 / DQS3-9A1) TaxID=443218 RepID=F6ELC4_HOYSD|nr:hypothetical protein AS9A_0762 [Hoyosella subflava DQS3-9A1]
MPPSGRRRQGGPHAAGQYRGQLEHDLVLLLMVNVSVAVVRFTT